MPGSIAAWTTLVEDRIQRAQLRGVFQNVKGRGKPFQVDTEESNPYIDRTEYLMNRIVQRQGAAPPWIDLQQRALLIFLALHRSNLVHRGRRTTARLSLDSERRMDAPSHTHALSSRTSALDSFVH